MTFIDQVFAVLTQVMEYLQIFNIVVELLGLFGLSF